MNEKAQPTKFRIIPDDLTETAIAELLSFHLEEVRRWSPACKVHAMPVERLREHDVTFFSAWHGETLAGCGALKELDAKHGELKSMRVTPDFRGKGAGRAILDHLIAEAVNREYIWLGLETGNAQEFVPAITLYKKLGFRECGPFGDYVSDEFSLYMEKAL